MFRRAVASSPPGDIATDTVVNTLKCFAFGIADDACRKSKFMDLKLFEHVMECLKCLNYHAGIVSASLSVLLVLSACPLDIDTHTRSAIDASHNTTTPGSSSKTTGSASKQRNQSGKWTVTRIRETLSKVDAVSHVVEAMSAHEMSENVLRDGSDFLNLFSYNNEEGSQLVSQVGGDRYTNLEPESVDHSPCSIM